MLKKNNHMHKIVFTWFNNLLTSMVLQRFHYYQGKKIQNAAVQFFFFLSKTTPRNPNHQNNDFYILYTGFTMDYKMSQQIFPTQIKYN